MGDAGRDQGRGTRQAHRRLELQCERAASCWRYCAGGSPPTPVLDRRAANRRRDPPVRARVGHRDNCVVADGLRSAEWPDDRGARRRVCGGRRPPSRRSEIPRTAALTSSGVGRAVTGDRRAPGYDGGGGGRRLDRCATPQSTAAIVGFRRPSQVGPLLAATEITFTEEEIKTIESAKVVSIYELLTPETISADVIKSCDKKGVKTPDGCEQPVRAADTR